MYIVYFCFLFLFFVIKKKKKVATPHNPKERCRCLSNFESRSLTVTSTTNNFHHIGIYSLSEVMVLRHFITIICY